MEKGEVWNRTLWTNSELYQIAAGLQKYGFSEVEKIAETIKTRDKDNVVIYLQNAERTLKKKYYAQKRKKAGCKEKKNVIARTPIVAEVKEWPAVRKWSWLAKKQQSERTRRLDYSAAVMENLIEGFWEEAEEPEDPQVIDVKSIYKFLYDCVTGKCPTELMPKESGVVLMLLKKLKELQDSMDLDEEKQFIATYKEAVKFAPENENVEIISSYKAMKCSVKEYLDRHYGDPNALKIPNEVFSFLDLHKTLVESFNPLNIPMWLIDKEQGEFSKLMLHTQKSNSEASNKESDT